MIKPIEIDREMLTLVRCPDRCQQGIGYQKGAPFFCGSCDGLAVVWFPVSLVSVLAERKAA